MFHFSDSQFVDTISLISFAHLPLVLELYSIPFNSIYALKKGLYFYDVKNDTAHVMINTVDSIKNKYTVKEYANNHKAHSIQDIIGRPATKDYIEYVEKGLILKALSQDKTF